MALHVPKAPGFQSMLKDGARVRIIDFKPFVFLTNRNSKYEFLCYFLDNNWKIPFKKKILKKYKKNSDRTDEQKI